MTIAEIAPLIRSGKVSPVELAESALKRIGELNPRLNAFITVTTELAMEQARAAEAEISAGRYRGPLHGIPFGAKDLFFTKGIRTAAGSKILANFVPGFDATVIERLRDAGAVLVGKTALHEFAYGVMNDNIHYGWTLNPWDTSRTPGGSSGGSAVGVATGMIFCGLGTDTAGSIRIPSSFCGVTGLKPTFGRVSCYGVFALAQTLDHAGPIARSVEDVAIAYRAMEGFDRGDPFSTSRPVDWPAAEPPLDQPAAGMRIGVPEEYFYDLLQPEVERAVREALRVFEGLGAVVRPAPLAGMADLHAAGRTLQSAEAYALHKKDVEEHRAEIADDVVALIELGKDLTAVDYVQANLFRQEFRRRIDRVFDDFDVLITPATAVTAIPFGAAMVKVGSQEESTRSAGTRLTRPWNAAGNPALSVPCGFDDNGLPVGMQIVGRWWNEAAVLRAGYAYQQATGWHKKAPSV